MQHLSAKYPAIAKHIHELKDDGSVRVVTSKIPICPTAVVRNDKVDWLIHSKDDPRREAEAYVHGILKDDIKFAQIVVVLGLGMGYHLAPIFQKWGTEDTFFVIIENNAQLFKKFIQTNRPSVQSNGQVMSVFDFDKVGFAVGLPLNQVYNYFFEMMQRMGRNAHSTFYFIEHPVLIRFNKDYYKPIIGEFNRICYDIRSSYGNDPEDSWIGINHMLMNLDTIVESPGINQVQNQFKGQPAVIVATGPSLNKNIDLLPQLKDKAVFFAADASLNTFFKKTTPIVPDICCSLERNLSTANHFNQIAEEKKKLMEDIWLCACPVVMPQVYKAWKGKNVSLFRDFAHFKWLGINKGIINTGKSVTNMAFKAAEYMGCDPIILVGQDLAFSPDGQSHVSGADHAREGLKGSPLIRMKTKVMGNNGQLIDSLDTWVGMLKRFEYDIAISGGGYKVINATEGGAMITGTEVAKLGDVIQTYCKNDIDVHNRLNGLLEYPSAIAMENDRAVIIRELGRGLEYMKYGINELKDAINAMEIGCKLFIDGIEDFDLKDLLNYCNRVKNNVIHHEMCYYTTMHCIQSWCMGRENIFRSIIAFYDEKEATPAKFVKIFEFFYGLRLLYEMLYEGIKIRHEEYIQAGRGVQGQALQEVQETVNC
jgi:hypothetical protein